MCGHGSPSRLCSCTPRFVLLANHVSECRGSYLVHLGTTRQHLMSTTSRGQDVCVLHQIVDSQGESQSCQRVFSHFVALMLPTGSQGHSHQGRPSRQVLRHISCRRLRRSSLLFQQRTVSSRLHVVQSVQLQSACRANCHRVGSCQRPVSSAGTCHQY